MRTLAQQVERRGRDTVLYQNVMRGRRESAHSLAQQVGCQCMTLSRGFGNNMSGGDEEGVCTRARQTVSGLCKGVIWRF